MTNASNASAVNVTFLDGYVTTITAGTIQGILVLFQDTVATD